MVVRELSPRVTAIKRIIDVVDGFIILEDENGYEGKSKSNIYKIDKEFKILWEIKEPSPGQILFKHIECIGGVLYVWNLASGRGELDPATGEVKNWGFTPFGFDC
jgi:hypothetical protein